MSTYRTEVNIQSNPPPKEWVIWQQANPRDRAYRHLVRCQVIVCLRHGLPERAAQWKSKIKDW